MILYKNLCELLLVSYLFPDGTDKIYTNIFRTERTEYYISVPVSNSISTHILMFSIIPQKKMFSI